MNVITRTAIRHWPQVAPLLRPAHSKAEHARLIEALDAVLDAGGANEAHPLARLADYLGDLIAEYEARYARMKEVPVANFLRELMRQQGLTQSQLPEIGTQSVVSEVLSGKRRLNVTQISRLSRRFKLPPEVFMP